MIFLGIISKVDVDPDVDPLKSQNSHCMGVYETGARSA